MAARNILLRTDSGRELGWFGNVLAAKTAAKTLPPTDLRLVLVIQTRDGVVLSRLFPRLPTTVNPGEPK